VALRKSRLIWSDTSGPSATTGRNGDLFLRTDTDTLYGPKDAGTWGSGVTLGGSGGPHAATHASGGGDDLKLDDLAAPDDNTDLDVSTAKHGLCPKLPGGTTNFFREDGTWQPASGGSGLTHPQVLARSLGA
jgi:hypothetical protein